MVSVPVFLHFWGPRLYGEWLILSALPTYLSLSDMGFGSVAGNDMTMRVAAGDREGALEAFQSAWALTTAVSVALGASVCAAVWWLPLSSWLHLSIIPIRQSCLVIVLLATYALVALQSGLNLAGFRCDGRYATGQFGAALVAITEATIATLAVAVGAKPVGTAAAYLAVRSGGTIVLSCILRRKSPWLHYGFTCATRSGIRRLAAPAFAFMAFPASNAISIQGMLIVVGMVLGPVAVTAFSTCRTLTRSAFQVLVAIKNAIWPELSVAFGAENWEFARKLHRRACQAALWSCLVAVSFLFVFGPRIYTAWTHGQVPLDLTLFHCLLIVVVANSFWYTSSTVSVACNKHQTIALAYLLGASASIALAYVLMLMMGLPGAALALLVIDLATTWYVLRSSVRIVKDSVAGFLKAMFTLPFNLPNRARANGD